eukprot:260145_1
MQTKKKYFVSARARKDGKLFPYYFKYLNLKRSSSLWSMKNRSGYIPLAVSENFLCTDLLISRLNKIKHKINISEHTLYYPNSVPFFKPLQNIFSNFIEKYIANNQSNKLNPNNITISAGVSAIIPVLLRCISEGNGNDILLIPMPYYATFNYDFCTKGVNMKIIVIPTSAENDYKIDKNVLNDLYNKYKTKIKCLFFTSPNNPTAGLYSKENILMIMNWCFEKRIHFIADEMYALCSLDKNYKFISSLNCLNQIDNQHKNDYFHFLYGLSKDFCLSGLRIGVLYTENVQIRKYVNVYLTYSVPIYMQQIIYHLLDNEQWIENFIRINSNRLQKRCNITKQCLDENNISYYYPKYGLFIWININKWLKNVKNKLMNTNVSLFQLEKLFFVVLANDENISIAPGECFGMNDAGLFRICFAIGNNENIIKDGIQRIVNEMNVKQFISKINALNITAKL